MRHRSLIASFAVLAVAASVLLGASPAMANSPTISFDTTSPVEVAFGGDWVITLKLSIKYDEDPGTYPLRPTDGTVDVSLGGVGGVFAHALPIQAGGVVYLSQSIGQPLLPAGEYQVNAIFNPAPGTYLATAQTAAPLILKVTALDLAPTISVSTDARVSEHPVITAALAGAYVDAFGGAPAGTWHFDVTKDGAQKPAYTVDLAQAPGESDPLRVEVAKRLDKGAHYKVTSTFTPVAEIAGGVTVADISPASFDTPEGTFGEALAAAAPLPLWLYITILVLMLGLIATTIVFGIRLRGRVPKPPTERPTAGEQRMPGDPSNVEIVGLGDLGLPEPATIPELTPVGEETKKLPTSTTWLLSDVEPATGLPSASEAPTERIDTVSAAELMTERLSTADIATERVDTSETATDGDDKPEAEKTE